MSFLAKFNTAIGEVKELLGITPDAPAKPVEKKEAIIKVGAGKNEDTFEIKNKPTKKEGALNLGNLRQVIESKCKEHGINYTEVSRNFSEIAGVTNEGYEVLSEKEKAIVLQAVDYTLDIQKKHGVSKQANQSAVIKVSASNVYKAVSTDNFASVEELRKEVDRVYAELDNFEGSEQRFAEIDPTERRARMDEVKKARKLQLEKELNALNKLPENEREAAKGKLRERYSFVDEALFNQIIATQDSETALHAITMLDAKHMNRGMSTVLETRSCNEEAKSTANMADLAFSEGLLNSYFNRGEDLTSDEFIETYREYTSTNISYKSYDYAQAYQEAYNLRREQFENGENVPPYYSQKLFTATAQGIGEGALNNKFMTADQKAEFMVQWEKYAVKFKEDKLIEQIKKEEKYQELQTKINEQKEKAQVAKENKKPETNATQKVTNPITKTSTSEVTSASENFQNIAPQKVKTTVTNPILQSKTNNEIEIKKDILEKGVQQAISSYGSSIVELILSDPSLLYLKNQLDNEIKSYSLQDLKDLLGTKPKATVFLYICDTVKAEYANELLAYCTGICYDVREIVEKKTELNKK